MPRSSRPHPSPPGRRNARRLRKRSLEEQWRRLEPACRQLALSAGAEAAPTFDDFLWAYSIFWSRALTFPCPTPSTAPGAPAAVVMQEGIVPGLDFCNHAPGSACGWTVFGGGRRRGAPTDIRLACPCGPGVKQGQEVTIDYGGKSNEELLFLYGFVQRGNPHEVLMLPCPLPPPAERDAALRARLELLRRRGLAPQVFLPAEFLDQPRAGRLRFHGRSRAGELSGVAPALSAAAVREEDLPEGVMRTLEVFVMEAADLRAALLATEGEDGAAGATADGGNGPSPGSRTVDPSSGREVGEVERSGLRMALLTTLVRLLELKAAELEGVEEGTGSLAADERLLQALDGAPPAPQSGAGAGAGGGGLSAAQRAALEYRVGQKRLARQWLAHASGLLAQEMRHLQALAPPSGQPPGLVS